MDNLISEDTASDPRQLRSSQYVNKVIDAEVKEIRKRQREDRIRSLTDVSLMLLMILVTVLAWTWFM